MNGTTPVVFLHAYPLNGGMWSSLREQVRGRRTLAPDFPGFGGRPPGPADLGGFAGSVMEEASAAGIERAVFVGLSMGGYVAFRIWSAWPERVAALVLADTRAGPDDQAAAERRQRQAERARREGVGWLADEMLGGLLGRTTRATRPEVVGRVRALMGEAEAEGVARALLAMRDRPDSRPLLATITVPTLVLVGEEDEITGPGEAKAMAEGIPGARLATIPRAGHLSNLENPGAFEAEVLEFLGGVA